MLSNAIFVALVFLAPAFSFAISSSNLACASAGLDQIGLRAYGNAADVEILSRVSAEYQAQAKKEVAGYQAIVRVTGQNNHEAYVECVTSFDREIQRQLQQYVNVFIPYLSEPKMTHKVYEGRNVVLKTGETVHVAPFRISFQKIVGLRTDGRAVDKIVSINGDYDMNSKSINFVFGLRYLYDVETYEIEIYQERASDKFYLDSDFQKPFRNP